MQRIALLAFLALVGAAVVSAQVAGDKITYLPGLSPQQNGTFDMYSGYITLASGRNYFYWFVGSSSKTAATDPVILWLNGGPGCSSLGGLMSENGPFSPDANNNLVPNPYSWNTVANMLYLESPAGVGFSWDSKKDTFTDNITASDNYLVVSKWFSLYPEYASNHFYIAGESYAGHYIPQLAYQIWQHTQSSPNTAPQSNFQGFLVGNPSTEYASDFGKGLTTYYQTHGLLALDDENQSNVHGNINPYDILVDVCNRNAMLEKIRFPHPLIDKLRKEEEKKKKTQFYVPNTPPCIDNYVQSYLQQSTVQTAIHAKPKAWVDCGGIRYTFGMESIIPYYKALMDNTKYKILVYSGDEDTVINFISTETWILALKRSVVTKWKPWYYARSADPNNGQQVGGWGIQYDRIAYKTVKGAGHMVPWWQPAPALQVLNDFLAGK